MCVCVRQFVRVCVHERERQRESVREYVTWKKCECARACMCDWFVSLVDNIELASMMYT